MWVMRRTWTIAAAGIAAFVAGCGGGADETPTMTLDPHPPRAVAPGHTIEIREDGRALQAGEGLPPLRTARAAREACASAPAVYVAWTYGVASRDLDVIARVVARRRAAPGMVEAVRAGCRSGLHRKGDRP
jgi:hypothetical protein